MLPAQHRLRTGADFSAVTRGAGAARAGSRLLVVHANATDSRAVRPPRVGFVVSKAVGGAVSRNRVKRRLRAQIAHRLSMVPAGADVVLRAQPGSATATSLTLGAELDQLLPRVLAKLAGPARPGLGSSR